MKKLIYSLLTLAAALSLASCQPDKLIGDKDGGDGKAANISITVSLGPKTKAFADGTKADKLFAGLYEIGNGPTYTHITHTAEAIAIDNEMRATVTFNGQIHRGNSYRLVFWAQKEGAPYSIDWATAATTGPTVTVTTYSGNTNLANDDTRDAFFGFYDAENVQGNVEVTKQNAIQLKRPFAQVNVLVPIANITTPAGAVASTMTVAQAPTVLNLATKATSAPEDWAFASNAIDEDPFAAYAPNDPNDPATHKYVAMNYVLVDQLAADARYDVGFTVSASAGDQTSGDKAVANVPLKPNGRTNIVGNVFADDFNISVPIIVSPGAGTEQELTTVTVAVGGMDEANAISLTDAYNSGTPLDIDVAVNHPITLEADKPEITVTPASVATAEWVLGTGLRVTPLVENGKAVITLVFPAVTKTAYAAATAQIYIKVGNGQNTAATPTFSPGAGEVAQGTPVTITSTTEGASIYYTTNGDEPTNASTLYEDPVVINSACTIKAIAIKAGFSNSAVAEAAYTIAAQAPTPLVMSAVTCTAQTENSLTFSWDAVEHADGYMISIDGGNNYGDTQNGTTYTWTGLNASTEYTLYVKAIGSGSYSDSPAGTASGTTTAAPTPLVMSAVTCTAQTENSLTFSWTAVEHADGYKVSLDGGNNYGDTQDGTSYTWTGLNASTEYTLYVKAVGSGSYSDSVAGTASGTTTAAPTPLVMSAVTCTAQTENSLTFSWDAVEHADGYKVSLDEGNTYGETQNATSYTWTGLSASTTKTIYVKAVGSGSYSDSSAGTASGTTSAAQAESVVYTLTPEATGGNSTPHNSYSESATITLDGIEWAVGGNSSMVPWRIGGKNITNQEREVLSKTAITENISKIVVTHGAASSITVNSVKLIVASDSSFETVVSEITKNDFAANSTMTFERPGGKSWANCYYKFVYNVTVSGNTNRFVEFSSAEFTGK